MTKSVLWIVLIVLTVLLTHVSSVLACSCMERETMGKAYRKADIVFVGTISNLSTVEDRDGFSDLKAKFLIEDPLKLSNKKTIDVFTSSQGTACGFPFEDDGRYLIFGYQDQKRGGYTTSICTRSRPVRLGSLDDEVEILKSLAKGRLSPRIFGTVYELTRGLYPLRGDYWDQRKPMPGVRIIAQSGEKRYEALSDAEGRFSIKDIPLGTYSVSFKLQPKYKLGGDYWDESTDEERKYYKNLQVTLTYADNPNSLRIETRVDGRIRGKILDQNGKPAGKDIPVTLVSKKTADKEVGDIDYVHAFTNSKGEYEFFGVPAGEYLLGLNIETRPHKEFPYPRTYYPGTANLQNSTPIKLEMGEILDDFDLQLPMPIQEVEVKGVVVDVNGNPVKGAIVEKYGLYSGEWQEEDGYAMHSIKQPSFEGRVETDDRGEFSMKLLKGNKYRLNPFLPMKDSYKDLLEGDEIDIEVTDSIRPVRLVLDRKPK